MPAAVFYVMSFIFSVSMLTLTRKTDKKVNAIVDVVFSYVTVLNIAALAAFVINSAGVSITLISMGIIFTLIGTVSAVITILKKAVQPHILRKTDICAVCVLVLAVGIFMLHVFTPYLHANYYNNVDPYNHFLYAQSIARSGNLTGMFYNSLYNGMFLKLFSWVLPQVWGYKAFILSDIYHIILELIFFYAVILLVTDKKKVGKYTPLFWSLFYWISFLMFSFLWGFVYWSMAAMLSQYLFMLIRFRNDDGAVKKTIWGYAGIGLFSLTMCYIQFAPMMLCAVLAIMLYDLYKAGKISFKWKSIRSFIGILIISAVVALIGYKYIFQDAGVIFLLALRMGEQQNIGLEVLLMLPWVMLIILKTVQGKNKMTNMQIAYVAVMVVQFLYTVLSICHIISTYYLQKSYIILFVLSIIVIIEGKENLSRKVIQSMSILGTGFLGFLILSYAGSESKTLSLQQSTVIQNLDILSEYDFSEGELSDNGKIYLMQYAIEELQDEKGTAALIVSGGIGRGTGLWFDATYDNATVIWLEEASCTEEQMDELLEQNNATQFIVFFDDLLYIYDLHEYFDSFERVYQNDAGFIGKYE